MSLYPNLHELNENAQIEEIPRNGSVATNSTKVIYPPLQEFMGMKLTDDMMNKSVICQTNKQRIIALNGVNKELIHNGVKELILCKDGAGKVGLRVKAIDGGIFVQLIVANSPAATIQRLHFGDQILQINDIAVTGMTADQVNDIFKMSPVNRQIKLLVRDRPFERTLTLCKNGAGTDAVDRCLGFQLKNGQVVNVVSGTSAANNGMLVQHHLVEVDGQNVIGMTDKKIGEIIKKSKSDNDAVRITVIPSPIYEHMIKKMAGNLLKNFMDHSVPTIDV